MTANNLYEALINAKLHQVQKELRSQYDSIINQTSKEYICKPEDYIRHYSSYDFTFFDIASANIERLMQSITRLTSEITDSTILDKVLDRMKRTVIDLGYRYIFERNPALFETEFYMNLLIEKIEVKANVMQ